VYVCGMGGMCLGGVVGWCVGLGVVGWGVVVDVSVGGCTREGVCVCVCWGGAYPLMLIHQKLVV